MRDHLGWRALLTRLGWAAVALAFSVTIAMTSLGYVTTMLVGDRAAEGQGMRSIYVQGVARQLSERFTESELASATPEVIREVARYAGMNYVGLTIWDTSAERPVIAIRLTTIPDASEPDAGMYTYAVVTLTTYEEVAIAQAARGDGFVSSDDVPLGGQRPSSTPLGYAPGYAAPDPAQDASSGALYRPDNSLQRYGSRLVLVITDPAPDWQEWGGITPNLVRQAVSANMFPWLFLAFMLPCSLALLALDRRDTVRAKLIATEERARLNRDAHDRVYNRLTALANQLAAGESPETQPPTPADQIRRTVSDLQSILGDGVAVPHLSAADAAASLLADVCIDQGRLWSMTVTLEGADALQGIDPRIGWELQCIAEEALTNASRHGRAKSARVRVSATGGALQLEIADDGTGIVEPLAADGLPANASGMRGMLERARALGGELAVATGAGGTSISGRIPLAKR